MIRSAVTVATIVPALLRSDPVRLLAWSSRYTPALRKPPS